MNLQFPSRLNGALAPALLLAACSPSGSDAASSAPADTEPSLLDSTGEQDCLLAVWSRQDPATREAAFDRDHDQREGGTISCATGTSASRFAAAIDALRTAAATGDRARLLDQLGLPLTYIDRAGERRTLSDRGAVVAAFDEIFDPAMLAALQALDLQQMAVAQGGGSFALGALWLVAAEPGGPAQLVTINRQALDEAARAARDKARRNPGAAAPFDER